jgi:hypothetical protein
MVPKLLPPSERKVIGGTQMIDRRNPDVADRRSKPFDVVEKPKHYNVHPSGYETIELTEFLNANLSNALIYCWRRNGKGNLTQDLSKAKWYARRHCENEIHIPIFASKQLLELFIYKATQVIRFEDQGSRISARFRASGSRRWGTAPHAAEDR